MTSGAGIETESQRGSGFAVGELDVERAVSLGEEAREIARLVAASVRGFEGRVISVRVDSSAEFELIVRDALAWERHLAMRNAG